MFHATSAFLGRLVRRIEARLAITDEYATWHGWETRQVRPGTREYRDPRFGQLAAIRATPDAGTPAATWAQAAIASRIRGLGTNAATGDVLGREA
jgi:hypothetical protein